jgi:hypothetical protein
MKYKNKQLKYKFLKYLFINSLYIYIYILILEFILYIDEIKNLDSPITYLPTIRIFKIIN